MKKIICDHCRVRNGITVSFELPCDPGPLGEGRWRFEHVDLCMQCLVAALEKFLKSEPLDVRLRLISIMTAHHTKAA
jgi:hypothetical protein